MTEEETVKAIVEWMRGRRESWKRTAASYLAGGDEHRASTISMVAEAEERVMEGIEAGDWKPKEEGAKKDLEFPPGPSYLTKTNAIVQCAECDRRIEARTWTPGHAGALVQSGWRARGNDWLCPDHALAERLGEARK